MDHVAVLGSGRLGSAVCGLLSGRNVPVKLWARRGETHDELRSRLPNVEISDDLAMAAAGASVVALAVPASAFEEVARAYGDIATGDQIVIHAVRGVCPGEDWLLPHTVLRRETCVRKIGVLGGPMYAPELAAGRPMGVVIASRFDEVSAAVQNLTKGTPLKAHPSHDVLGVEVAGAVSNVSALAVGMADALGLGEMARGIALTLGLSEAALLGRRLGALPDTFSGLAGVGDLIPRHVASTERHHAIGEALARGRPLAEAIGDKPCEGVDTAYLAAREAQRMGLDLQLISSVNAVCRGEMSADEALAKILKRDIDLDQAFDLHV